MTTPDKVTITLVADPQSGWIASANVDQEFWNTTLGPLVLILCESLDIEAPIEREYN